MYIQIWWMVKFCPRIAFEPVSKCFPQNPKCARMQNGSVSTSMQQEHKRPKQCTCTKLKGLWSCFLIAVIVKSVSPCCMCLQLTGKQLAFNYFLTSLFIYKISSKQKCTDLLQYPETINCEPPQSVAKRDGKGEPFFSLIFSILSVSPSLQLRWLIGNLFLSPIQKCLSGMLRKC